MGLFERFCRKKLLAAAGTRDDESVETEPKE